MVSNRPRPRPGRAWAGGKGHAQLLLNKLAEWSLRVAGFLLLLRVANIVCYLNVITITLITVFFEFLRYFRVGYLHMIL